MKHTVRQSALRILLTVLGDPDRHCSDISNKYFLRTNQILAFLFCGSSLLLVSTWEKYSLPWLVEKLLSPLLSAAVYTERLGCLTKLLSISWAAFSLWQTWLSIIQALLHHKWPECGYFGGAQGGLLCFLASHLPASASIGSRLWKHGWGYLGKGLLCSVLAWNNCVEAGKPWPLGA